MDELGIALIKDGQRLPNRQGFKIIGPEIFQDQEGLTSLLSELHSNPQAIYVDRVFGIIIAPSARLNELQVGKRWLASANDLLESLTIAPIALEDKQKPISKLPPFWHVARLGGWPQEVSGRGVRIGIIDSGVDLTHPSLSNQNHASQFASLQPSVGTAKKAALHGTRCAGLIAGTDGGGFRTGAAPDCELYVGQVSGATQNGRIVCVDLILLACWAVHWGKVKAISFSIAVGAKEVRKHGDPALISWIAWRLRRRNVALLFCATGNLGAEMLLPAACSGVVAVGGYDADPSHIARLCAKTKLSGFDQYPPLNRDLLLGPATHVYTTQRLSDAPGATHYDEEFGDSSAACAWVAGIAALYFERYPESTVEEVLLRMFQDAETVHCPHGSGRTWKAARFPL